VEIPGGDASNQIAQRELRSGRLKSDAAFFYANLKFVAFANLCFLQDGLRQAHRMTVPPFDELYS
jgi:hypothetical protein